MIIEKISNKGQAQLFNNRFLEMLTKTHPLVIWMMYLPVLSYLVYLAVSKYEFSTATIIFTFLGGSFFWTFFEYIAHRFLFHLSSENPKIQKIGYVIHGNHHHYPRDRQRLFMPPVPSAILSFLIFGIMFLLIGKWVFMFFPGFIFGYLLYASLHYAIHAWAPPFSWMKALWRNHHLHHYKQAERGFGVSSTFWDRVFGTMFDLKNEIEDKEKVKELMFEKK